MNKRKKKIQLDFDSEAKEVMVWTVKLPKPIRYVKGDQYFKVTLAPVRKRRGK